MGNGEIMKQTKIFNGKKYHLLIGTHKRHAKNYAKDLRKDGYNAKAIHGKGKFKDTFYVYYKAKGR